MPLEVKDIKEVFAIPDDIDSPEKLKEFADDKFKKTKKDATGLLYGSSIVALKRGVKDLTGEDLTTEETEGKELPKIIDSVVPKFKKKIEDLTLEIESVKKSIGEPNEKIKELETERDSWKTKYVEEKNTKAGLAKDFDAFKLQAETKEKNLLKDFKVKDKIEKEFKWSSDADILRKEGYFKKFNEKYKIELDETGEPIPVDQSGNRIPHPKRANDFMTLMELHQKEATELKVWEVNPHAEKNKQIKPAVTSQFQNPNPTNAPVRPVAPRVNSGVVRNQLGN